MAKNPFSNVMDRFKSSGSSTKSDEVSVLQGKLNISMDLRRTNQEPKWNKFTSIFNLERRSFGDDEIVRFNTHRGHQIQTKMINLLTFRDPKWNVLPYTNEAKAKDNASVWRGYLSWYMYHHDVRDDVHRPFVRDTVICGTGVNQTGFKTDPLDEKNRTSDQEVAEQMRLAEEAGRGEISEEDIQARLEEIHRDIVKIPPEDTREQNAPNEPYYQNVSIWDFWIAPGYTSIEKAYNGGGWVCKRIVIPVSRAKADPRYKNRKHIKSTNKIDSPAWDFLENHSDSLSVNTKEALRGESEFAELFEMWIAPDPFKKGDQGKVKVFQKDGEHFFFEGENPYPEINGFPFVSQNFKDREGEFFGVPYLEHLHETLDNFDLMRSVQLDIAKVKKPLNVGQEGINEDIDAKRLAAARAGSTILMKNPAGFQPFQWPDASPELLNEVVTLSQEILVGSGVGPNQLGAGLPSGSSATEASIVQQNIVSDIQTNSERLSKEI